MTTADRVATALASRAVATRVTTGGYSTAERLVIELADGRSVFAKCAHEEVVAEFLRDEHRLYSALEADYMPRFVAFIDEPPPILVLEDLSDATWPPPWPSGAVDVVLKMLAHVHATPPPAGVSPISRDGLVDGWARIENEPAPFLSLGVCSPDWLAEALPRLRDASETAPVAGYDFLHLDVRSDNICLLEARAVLVDWNWACVGNGELDVAAWLPSLHLEGGPLPDEVLPACEPGLAALLAGFWGSRAGLPPGPTAPHVRPFQLAQVRIALPWAARLLGLPEPR